MLWWWLTSCRHLLNFILSSSCAPFCMSVLLCFSFRHGIYVVWLLDVRVARFYPLLLTGDVAYLFVHFSAWPMLPLVVMWLASDAHVIVGNHCSFFPHISLQLFIYCLWNTKDACYADVHNLIKLAVFQVAKKWVCILWIALWKIIESLWHFITT